MKSNFVTLSSIWNWKDSSFPLSFFHTALLIFRTEMKRDPQTATQDDDLKKLFEIRDHVQHEMKLNDQVVENDVFK